MELNPNICREPLAPECGEVAVKIVECRVERHHLHPERLGTPRQRRQRRRARRIVVARDIEAFERSEEHTSELQSLMRISYAVFCLKKTTHIYMSLLSYL